MGVLLRQYFLLLAFYCRMSSADRNDLVPAQEKLEWVTPKISLMDAGDSQGKNAQQNFETAFNSFGAS